MSFGSRSQVPSARISMDFGLPVCELSILSVCDCLRNAVDSNVPMAFLPAESEMTISHFFRIH